MEPNFKLNFLFVFNIFYFQLLLIETQFLTVPSLRTLETLETIFKYLGHLKLTLFPRAAFSAQILIKKMEKWRRRVDFQKNLSNGEIRSMFSFSSFLHAFSSLSAQKDLKLEQNEKKLIRKNTERQVWLSWSEIILLILTFSYFKMFSAVLLISNA